MDNLRPLVVPGDAGLHVVCWFRGTMVSSQAYNAEVAALIQPAD
ncbi:hypothetical protein ARTHRO9AX_130071 [Arthrobacter sp. 9AX]|nr:hypothetical protein ARTHRO9AX_130071 [Arthrobacter sp. 9AX]